MNTNLLVKNDVVSRVWNKIDSMAESKGMTRQEFIEWSKAERYRSSISDYERDLIFAYQVSKAIERLEINDKHILVESTGIKYSWINKFKYDFISVDKAMEHLKEVCEYMLQQEGREYDYKWLFDYDNVLFDRIIKESKKKNKKNILIRKD